MTKNLPTKKSLRLQSFTGQFCQTFEEELIPIFLKLSPKMEDEGILSTSFYEARIARAPKPGKDIPRKLQTHVFCKHKHRDFGQNTSRPTSALGSNPATNWG